ncbi:hypothetical protein [Streptomyces eurythermus]
MGEEIPVTPTRGVSVSHEKIPVTGLPMEEFEELLEERLKDPTMLHNRPSIEIVSPSAGKVIRYRGNPDF